jgi:tetratricopeptide (TPR) repeat protein
MDEMICCWDLIEQGRFEEACVKADNEFATTKSLLSLRNKVIALLNLEEFNKAIDLCEFLIKKEQGESEFDYKFAGTAFWLLGETARAVDMWKKGLETKYTDSAGGVEVPSLMFFAATALGNKILEIEAADILKKRWRSKRSVNWPGPIAGYLLGEIKEQEILEGIDARPSIRAKQLCQALFYIAIVKMKNGEEDTCCEFLRQAVSLNTSSYQKQEYYLAKGELKKRH